MNETHTYDLTYERHEVRCYRVWLTRTTSGGRVDRVSTLVMCQGGRWDLRPNEEQQMALQAQQYLEDLLPDLSKPSPLFSRPIVNKFKLKA